MIVGLDMGGTHVDAVIIEDGRIINTIKKPTNRDNLFESIWNTLEELLKGYDKSKIKRINLSTTVSTNAIVENTTSPVGMIIQSGPGLPQDFLACGEENVFISGYIDHRGTVVENWNHEEIKEAINIFKGKKINSLAVVTKFSIRNPSHELEIKEMIEAENRGNITLGHTMSGKLNFPRRVYTSYLNSAVYDTFNDFSNNIIKSMEKENIKAPVYILKADGGTMSLSTAEEKPVETILSGPAASFMGINAMLSGDEDAILLDIGGTTTDIFFLADGVPLFEPLGIKIDKYKTLVRAIYSLSIGLGGDSSISIKDGKIKIGPKREGVPYAYGGPAPTPTDAMITLGLMEGEKEKAYKIMKSLGKKLNMSAENISNLILDTMANMIKMKVDEVLKEINSQPVYTVKELLYGKTIEPKLINIIGGPAKVLAPILEKKFHLPCYYPDKYEVANAVGAALAKPTTEINMLVDTAKGILTVPELNIYENISKKYTLEDAKKKALELVKESVLSLGAEEDQIEAEITEESSFNMVRGFFTSGKNIRIKAQVKPGLIYDLRGDSID
ncbi:MAG: hydantoinase/oxoprolinase family protein [Tissierellia bacterium]|nr:hydantoinase/oxoprolinase family protein [Tissierellia bacterium]